MPEQLYIAGTEPPGRIPEIDEAIAEWLESKEVKKAAGDAEAGRHETVLERMAEAGRDRYTFLDPTGRRRVLVAKSTRKATVEKAPAPQIARRDAEFDRDTREAAEPAPRKQRPPAASDDPFAGTRAAMSPGLPNLSVVPAEGGEPLTPAQQAAAGSEAARKARRAAGAKGKDE